MDIDQGGGTRREMPDFQVTNKADPGIGCLVEAKTVRSQERLIAVWK